MRALVVFESMFGNTEQVARAVAEGLAEHADVEVVNVDDATDRPDPDLDLLVVGAPTHALGLSSPATRRDAAGRTAEPLVSRQRGLREWLEAQRDSGAGAAAAFCTKAHSPRWLPGSAARAAARRLRRCGYRMAAAPAAFSVDAIEGPITAGEVERARRWGAGLATARGTR